MNRDEDGSLCRHFEELPEIPFDKALEERILKAAAQELRRPAQSARRKGLWKPWLAAVSGVVAVVFVLSAIISHPGKSAPKTSAHSASAFTGYQLKASALKVQYVKVGTISGEPQNSSVIAKVKNVGNEPIGKTDVFGVLAFPATTAQNLLRSGSLFFVNGPSKPLPPGQSTVWTFHPVGAPHDSFDQLTQKPSLVFYGDSISKYPPSSGSTVKNTVVWKRSADLVIDRKTVSLKSSGSTWNAARVQLIITNKGHKSLALKQCWVVTWYENSDGSTAPSWNWGASGDTRFINRLQANAASIAPGEQLGVYFDIVGSPSFDFLRKTPQVAIVEP